MKPFIVILTGPTCAGKSTLERMLRDVGFRNAVSTTTRPMRAGEVDGTSYHFITKERFIAMLEAGEFVEHVEFGGNFYGLTKAEAQRIASYGAPMVIVCEPQGREQIIAFCQQHGWAHHAVYVGNPDKVIAQRFLKRLADESWGMSCEEIEAITERYAGRMEQMMTIERAWAAEAYFQGDMNSADHPYDRLLFNFDKTNDTQVVDSIVEEFRIHKLGQERLAA